MSLLSLVLGGVVASSFALVEACAYLVAGITSIQFLWLAEYIGLSVSHLVSWPLVLSEIVYLLFIADMA